MLPSLTPCPSWLGRYPCSRYMLPSCLPCFCLSGCWPSHVSCLFMVGVGTFHTSFLSPGSFPPHSVLSTSSGPGFGVWCLRFRGFSTAFHRLHCVIHFLLLIACVYQSVYGVGDFAFRTSSRQALLVRIVVPHPLFLHFLSFFPVLSAAMPSHDVTVALNTVSLTRRRIAHTWYR